jgi:uncharacterized membrane protein YebE (DUF533 family)
MTSPRMIAASLALAASTLIAAPAFAYEGTGIAREFSAQQTRIEQGVRSGRLTYREAAILRGEQDRIAGMIARARRDGFIDRHERSEIERAQASASQHIYAEKHDRQAAPHPRRFGWWHRTSDEGYGRRWW